MIVVNKGIVTIIISIVKIIINCTFITKEKNAHFTIIILRNFLFPILYYYNISIFFLTNWAP